MQVKRPKRLCHVSQQKSANVKSFPRLDFALLLRCRRDPSHDRVLAHARQLPPPLTQTFLCHRPLARLLLGHHIHKLRKPHTYCRQLKMKTRYFFGTRRVVRKIGSESVS